MKKITRSQQKFSKPSAPKPPVKPAPKRYPFFYGRPDETLFSDVNKFLANSGKNMSKHIVECVRIAHPLIVSGRAAVMK